MSGGKRAWNVAFGSASEAAERAAPETTSRREVAKPWEAVRATDPMPLMFQVAWSAGRVTSFAYSDLRIVDCVDPGEIILSLYSMEKLRLTITGRNLAELARLLSLGRTLSIHQTAAHDWFELPEREPAIESIELESLTGPS